LRALTDGRGSPLFALTWKAWAMPSGPPICALRASGLHTSGNGSTSWPSPRAADGWKGSRTIIGAQAEILRRQTGDDLSDPATYLLALRQYAERAADTHPSEAASVAALLRHHWPDVLAALLDVCAGRAEVAP